MFAGFSWLRLVTCDGLLRLQHQAFGIHQRQEGSCPAALLSASEEGVCSMEFMWQHRRSVNTNSEYLLVNICKVLYEIICRRYSACRSVHRSKGEKSNCNYVASKMSKRSSSGLERKSVWLVADSEKKLACC
jgi:hypothetical protein